MKKAAAEKSELQTLFDEMFAMAVDDNRQPIFPDSKQSTATEQGVQVDPMDAILLLCDPLTALATSGSSDSSRALECLERHNRCLELMTNSNTDTRRLAADDLAYINGFIADAQALLDPKVLDDTSWGGVVPAPLLLKGIVGGLDLVDIEKEEVFMVRGASYLQDSEKVPAAPPLFHMRGMQVVEQPKGVAARAATKVALQDWCGFNTSQDTCNEWLIVNYMVPGVTTVNVVCLYTASRAARRVIQCVPCHDDSASFHAGTSTPGSPRSPHSAHSTHSAHGAHNTHSTPGGAHSSRRKTITAKDRPPLPNPASWANCIYRFWGGGDDYRNRSFKLFPRMCKSSWAIQAAVGKKPALIGNKKLELTYTRGRNYLEIDIDLSSSSIATHILGMVRGVSKHMVVDLGIGIEGTREDELPEAILCQTRFDRVDLDGGASLSSAVTQRGCTAETAGGAAGVEYAGI